MSEKIVLNINTADAESLTDLPGVGPALAERIIANRPYSSTDELADVQGFGSQSLEKLQGLITIEADEGGESSPPEDALPDHGEVSSDLEETPPQEGISPFDVFEEDEGGEEDEAGKKAEAAEESEISEATEEKIKIENVLEPENQGAGNLITLSRARWLAFSSALIAIILALVLTLGLLASLNGGLDYTTQNQSQTLAADLALQIDGLTTKIDALSQDIDGLRERIDNLDHLGNRVDELDEQLTATQGEIETLSQQLVELQENSGKYQTFFEDLQQLLNNLFQSEEDNDL